MEPIATSPPKSPQLAVPTSAAARVLPAGVSQNGEAEGGHQQQEEALSGAMADAEAGMEEILPLDARTALLDYKPGDVVVTPTGRGWHVIKVDETACIFGKLLTRQLQECRRFRRCHSFWLWRRHSSTATKPSGQAKVGRCVCACVCFVVNIDRADQ